MNSDIENATELTRAELSLNGWVRILIELRLQDIRRSRQEDQERAYAYCLWAGIIVPAFSTKEVESIRV